jgi:MFS family permease
MIPGGRVADRFGPRRVLTVIGFGAALFTGLTAPGGKPMFGIWLGVLRSFLAIRLALGAFTAPLYPSCAILNARWTPPATRAHIWRWMASGSGIRGALAPLLFTWLIDRFGWRMSFVTSAVITGLLDALWYVYVRDSPHGDAGVTHSQVKKKTPWRALFGNRHLMLLVLVQSGRDRAMMTERNGLFQSKHCSRDGISTGRSSSCVSAGRQVSN